MGSECRNKPESRQRARASCSNDNRRRNENAARCTVGCPNCGEQHLAETQTGELFDAICGSREVTQEQVTAAYAADRPNHAELAEDLWSRLDAFWLRRSGELRARIDNRIRSILDGASIQQGMQQSAIGNPQSAIHNPQSTSGILAEAGALVDQHTRRHGLVATMKLIEALLERLQAAESSLRAGQQTHETEAQAHRQQAEHARDELLALAQQQLQLQEAGDDVSLLSRLWRAVQAFFTGGSWRDIDLDDEELARELEELNLHAEEQRHQYLNHFNQTVSHRLAAETRAAAAQLIAGQLSAAIG